MESIRFLPTSIHGVLDYVVGIILILTPWIFGFSDLRGVAMWTPIVLGAAIVVYSLLTNYEFGLIKAIPMTYHLGLDYIIGILLITAPFALSFNNEASKVWYPSLIIGVILIVVAFVSDSQSNELPMS